MKIVNIDAPEDLVERIMALDVYKLVLDTVNRLEQTCNPMLRPRAQRPSTEPMWKYRYFDYNNISVFVHTVPIYLRDSNPRDIEKDNIDLFGSYYKSQRGKSPYIELYLTEINKYSGKDDLQFKWLSAKTLIHEMAHAALDILNWNGFNPRKKEKVLYNTEFGRWREESMANAITLRIIKDSGDKLFYKYAKQFMLTHQPPEYALGVKMVNFTNHDLASVALSKELGVNSKLQKSWLEYAKGRPSWKGLQNWNMKLVRITDSLLFLIK